VPCLPIAAWVATTRRSSRKAAQRREANGACVLEKGTLQEGLTHPRKRAPCIQSVVMARREGNPCEGQGGQWRKKTSAGFPSALFLLRRKRVLVPASALWNQQAGKKTKNAPGIGGGGRASSVEPLGGTYERARERHRRNP